MAENKVKERKNIPEKYRWNVEAMYPDEAQWEKDVSDALAEAEAFGRYSGKLADSAAVLLEALTAKDRIWQRIEKAFVYASMKKDEDNRADKYRAMADFCGSAVSKISAATAFFAPELMEIPPDTIEGFLAGEPGLSTYAFLLKDALRKRGHVLSAPEERLLARLSDVFGAPRDLFGMLSDAELDFGTVAGEDGEDVPLTHGSYISLMESQNREVRKAAFTGMYSQYKKFSGTLAVNYNSSVKQDVISAELRKYPSSLAAALDGDNIPLSVYHSLIDAVREKLPAMHRYMQLRKKALGLKELHMYDVYVPLVKLPKKEFTFEEAAEIMVRALAPLGEDYLSVVREGIERRWVDVFETPGKTSGAYSFGSFDSDPYILMNFSGRLDDVFTLVHEMGHSMHSYYTRRTQSYAYGDHSIFTAEVASTVNESLLIKRLLADETSPDMKKYLYSRYIESFRTTLFRQTMFAEFELMAHEYAESGGVLTSRWLCDTYQALNDAYYGPAMEKDEYIRYEWARIPHFYRSFYVYQYATGYSAAEAVSSRILKLGEPASRQYREFLKSGSCDYPVELLKIAGADMSSPEPVKAALATFENLVDELTKML